MEILAFVATRLSTPTAFQHPALKRRATGNRRYATQCPAQALDPVDIGDPVPARTPSSSTRLGRVSDRVRVARGDKTVSVITRKQAGVGNEWHCRDLEIAVIRVTLESVHAIWKGMISLSFDHSDPASVGDSAIRS